MQPRTIAIDGPAASGKSTVGHALAERLGFLYFDTGAMYRAVTFLALVRGIDLADKNALGALAEEARIEIAPPPEPCSDARQYTVLADNEDITWEIRHHLVDRHVSEVAAQPLVRAALRRQQRRVGLRGSVVMVGRDIGTVVMPDAILKIYLDASIEERARRRYEELVRRGEQAEQPTIMGALEERDRYDSSRAEAPLRPAEDAYILNTSGLPVEEVVEAIVALAESSMAVENNAECAVE